MANEKVDQLRYYTSWIFFYFNLNSKYILINMYRFFHDWKIVSLHLKSTGLKIKKS
jgi:hypothetical protein